VSSSDPTEGAERIRSATDVSCVREMAKFISNESVTMSVFSASS